MNQNYIHLVTFSMDLQYQYFTEIYSVVIGKERDEQT